MHLFNNNKNNGKDRFYATWNTKPKFNNQPLAAIHFIKQKHLIEEALYVLLTSITKHFIYCHDLHHQHELIMQKPSTFTVWKRSLLVNGKGGFTVFDSFGNLVFRVDDYPSQAKHQLSLMDAVGNILLSMRYKVILLNLLFPISCILLSRFYRFFLYWMILFVGLAKVEF